MAEEHGAVALLMFPHPSDVKTENETGYPDTWGLPEGGKPRGSINIVKGDPLTPEWPSTGMDMLCVFRNFFVHVKYSCVATKCLRGIDLL